VFPNAVLARSELWNEVERSGGARRPRFKKKDLDERRKQVSVPSLTTKQDMFTIGLPFD
jgi:ribonuclease P/MRP protein subunit POP1